MLKGEMISRDDPYLLISVGGVGYKVLGATSVLANSVLGKTITLFIYTHVREDNISLFGFLDSLDLKLFERLISVSGVGPKTAMNIFSVGTREEIESAIALGDDSFFLGVPRLGKKNAQKIIIELKGKVDLSDSALKNGEGNKDIVGALKNFGFTSSEINQALQNVNGQGKSTAEKIKLALKYLGK